MGASASLLALPALLKLLQGLLSQSGHLLLILLGTVSKTLTELILHNAQGNAYKSKTCFGL